MDSPLAALVLLVVGVGTPALPQDARLAPVRSHLNQLLDQATTEGLPTDLLVSKIREGLAKGIDGYRIDQAVGRLADNLHAAKEFATARRGGAPSGGLVRALAEAKLAGVELVSTEVLLRKDRPEVEATRAVDALTDLSLRGYPPARASLLVRDVLLRDRPALERVPAALEIIRRDQALSAAEAVDALSRGVAASDSLQSGLARTIDDERRRNISKGQGKAKGDTDSPGRNDLAPGHLPKSILGRGRKP